MKIHIVENGKSKIRLWFPIILIWLVLLFLAIAISAIVLIAALILWPRSLGKKLLMFGPIFFYLLSSLGGLNIQTQSQDSKVLISIK